MNCNIKIAATYLLRGLTGTSNFTEGDSHCCEVFDHIFGGWLETRGCGVLNRSVESTLWDPMDCSLPGSSVHGDSPGKNIGVGCHAFSRVSSRPRDWTQVPHTAGGFFTGYTSLNLYPLSMKWTSEIFRGPSNLPEIQLRAWKKRKFKSSKFKSIEKEYFALKFYCSHKESGKYWQLFILK